MTNEIAVLRGRLALSRELMSALEISIDGDIAELRVLADRYEPKATLNTGRQAAVALRIDKDAQQYRALAKVVDGIKKDLGEE